MPVKIAPKDIKLGYAIKLPVGWMKHPFLTNKLVVASQQQIRIIQSLELDYVYFYPERSSVIADTVTDTTDNSMVQNIEDVGFGRHPGFKGQFDCAEHSLLVML